MVTDTDGIKYGPQPAPDDYRIHKGTIAEFFDDTAHCEQCGSWMNPAEAIGGAVCMKCCKANHKATTK